MERIHPNLFHGISREEWRAAVAALDARIDTLRSDQVTVELMRLVALVSSHGRDGHMAALPSPETHPPVYGLGFYPFSDGLFVDFAVPAYASLVGSRVTAIDGHPIAEWIKSYRAVEALDFDLLATGHGSVVFAKEDVGEARGFLEDLRSAVLAGISAGRSLEELQKTITLEKYKHWAYYDRLRSSNIAAAYTNLRMFRE